MVEERIREVFAGAGAEGLLHAVPVGARPPGEVREVAVGADEPVAIASIFKVLLVLEFARQVAAGQLDPRERVRVTAADRLGGWGTAGCADDVELSLRDLAFFAMSVSDNAAADLLLDRVGLDTVRLLAKELGLDRTRIVGGPRDVLESMLAEVGAGDEREFAVRYPSLPDDRKRRMAVLDPLRTNASTPRETSELLRLIWRDEAGSREACAQVRDLMRRQVFRHRLVSGFPDDVTVAAKTGTLPGLHMETGVVRYPDGGCYAISVFARTRELTAGRPTVDAAIGAAAGIAVDFLRNEGL
ncbi:class A beta-lactamase-related serine hydrolase [Streptomyces sp. NBC_01340]|uniref:serine hydrolase n=1 Tax=unclassified Streptomyces TaxID=2593676 RepID=UPI002251F324|nr:MULTISPECIES: serine hydrolase [unclassified Streptomyces]MCX4457310.1 class A beta-lactamase-related serine hydrolase [Streptomyces sp. NBC_01719]MCX4496667.1 class A beta-lactamase-related serine hydrolase [Streptomyces sp. NBC_01728]WSI41567.1 class A beta-lactamase-related serine hydrolase [Streptomyces sp. NBC_01340]